MAKVNCNLFEKSYDKQETIKYAHLEAFKNQNVKFFSYSFLTIVQKYKGLM